MVLEEDLADEGIDFDTSEKISPTEEDTVNGAEDTHTPIIHTTMHTFPLYTPISYTPTLIHTHHAHTLPTLMPWCIFSDSIHPLNFTTMHAILFSSFLQYIHAAPWEPRLANFCSVVVLLYMSLLPSRRVLCTLSTC